VIDAGNIGTPLAAVVLAEARPDWVSLEMSSFQLHDTPSVRPTVGVLTNLSPDHLDRYDGVADYFADKARLFANAHAGSHWVANADDAAVIRMTDGVAGTRHTFSVAQRPGAAGEPAAWLDRAADALMLGEHRLIGRAEFPLIGDHNVANALAAMLAVTVATQRGADQAARDALAGGLRSFRALTHRLEPAGTYRGVEWINDSKATNLSSTLVALEGMTKPYVLLLGGRHKGEPYTALAEPFKRFGRQVLAYGEAAELIERDLAPLVPVERLGSSFEAVVARARDLARPGDVVLLSPACSSYDMFNNYEERGAAFKRLAGATGA